MELHDLLPHRGNDLPAGNVLLITFDRNRFIIINTNIITHTPTDCIHTRERFYFGFYRLHSDAEHRMHVLNEETRYFSEM